MIGKPSISTTSLIALWLVAVGGALGRAFFEWPGWNFLVGLSGFLFILVLIWALARARPAASELPAPEVFTALRRGFWVRTLLLFLGLVLTFFLGLVITPGASVMLACGLLGLILTLAWRAALTWKIAGIGLAIGLICLLGAAFLGTGDLTWALFTLLTIPPAFTGGALLLAHTHLGHVRLLEGRLLLVLNGFLVGCVLALPPALLENLGGMYLQDTFIVGWWQPLYAIVPALAEETWARLLLLSFCYAVLRPVSSAHPRRAIIVAILISALAFTFAHSGLDPLGFLYGLLFSLPHALLFIKMDFEHAVGYHFLIDFARYVAAFLS